MSFPDPSLFIVVTCMILRLQLLLSMMLMYINFLTVKHEFVMFKRKHRHSLYITMIWLTAFPTCLRFPCRLILLLYTNAGIEPALKSLNALF